MLKTINTNIHSNFELGGKLKALVDRLGKRSLFDIAQNIHIQNPSNTNGTITEMN